VEQRVATNDEYVTIHHGDAWTLSPTLAPQSIHTIVTSPPYWGLRDYGEPGQFGLEPTPEAYVARLVELFALLRPALRDDGTVWLNLGDSFCGSPPGNKPSWATSGLHGAATSEKYQDTLGKSVQTVSDKQYPGLKPKDLVGIPWRVAFALQADGWYLRSDIIWHKPNPMPESVTDRPTKSHEYIFLLSKQARYFYDAEAIKEPAEWARWGDQTIGKQQQGTASWIQPKTKDELTPRHNRADVPRGGFDGKNDEPGKEAFRSIKESRNKRTVWTVPTRPFSQAHFAVFPPDLIRPCILAGCPELYCVDCGRPLTVVECAQDTQDDATQKGSSHDGQEAERSTGLSGVRSGVSLPQSSVLFEAVCESQYGSEQGDNSGVRNGSEGLQTHSQPVTPDGNPRGVCHGASNGDGGTHREDAHGAGGRSPQERESGRQSDREPRTDGEVGSRPQAQAACETDTVSPLWRNDSSSAPRCPACGSTNLAKGVVLDPFVGSGTTAEVARSLGRKAVGFELNADYIEIAAKHRLAQGVLL
jgi:DNA modification methylase